jgi:hypothetical protein
MSQALSASYEKNFGEMNEHIKAGFGQLGKKIEELKNNSGEMKSEMNGKLGKISRSLGDMNASLRALGSGRKYWLLL